MMEKATKETQANSETLTLMRFFTLLDLPAGVVFTAKETTELRKYIRGIVVPTEVTAVERRKLLDKAPTFVREKMEAALKVRRKDQEQMIVDDEFSAYKRKHGGK
jgi:hypothetical protein